MYLIFDQFEYMQENPARPGITQNNFRINVKCDTKFILCLNLEIFQERRNFVHQKKGCSQNRSNSMLTTKSEQESREREGDRKRVIKIEKRKKVAYCLPEE